MKLLFPIISLILSLTLLSCSNSVTESGTPNQFTIQGQATGDDATGRTLEVTINNWLLPLYNPAVLTSSQFASDNNFSVTLPVPPDSNLQNIKNNTFGTFFYFQSGNISDTSISISNTINFRIPADSNRYGRLSKVSDPSGLYKYVFYFYSTGSSVVTGKHVYHNYPTADSLVTNMNLNLTAGWNILTQRIDVMGSYIEQSVYSGDSPECTWIVSMP